MLRAATVLASVAAASAAVAPDATLVEVSPVASPSEWRKLRKWAVDRDMLESVRKSDAQVWASPEDVETLRGMGFSVKSDGVVNESVINAEAAFRANYTDVAGQEPDWAQYCDFNCMEARLTEIVGKCGDIFTLESIGQSVQGRDIWVVRATSTPTETKPEVLVAANIHGDEVTGGQLVQRLLWETCENHTTDTRLANILRDTDTYYMPMFNPDGYMRRQRGNANGRDLNRDFPNTWTSDNDDPTGRQPETRHMMDFVRDRDFKISLMYHGGAECVNYPYDSLRPGTSGYSATSRDDEVVKLAKIYADNHANMADSRSFPGGIVNGAVWYVIYGSHQDHMFDYRNEAIDLTLEVSNTKWPAASQLPRFYNDNYNALLSFIEFGPEAL